MLHLEHVQIGRPKRGSLRGISEAAWNVEQDSGTIVFETNDHIVEAPGQIVGAYRGPAGTTMVFFTFGEVTIRKK